MPLVWYFVSTIDPMHFLTTEMGACMGVVLSHETFVWFSAFIQLKSSLDLSSWCFPQGSLAVFAECFFATQIFQMKMQLTSKLSLPLFVFLNSKSLRNDVGTNPYNGTNRLGDHCDQISTSSMLFEKPHGRWRWRKTSREIFLGQSLLWLVIWPARLVNSFSIYLSS